MKNKIIDFEGYSKDEILNVPDEELDRLIFNEETLVFRVGSAEILGRFKISTKVLSIELAEMKGGGEGVLLSIGSLAEMVAKKRGIFQIAWYVHAVSCVDPNLKLKRVLEKRKFQIKQIEGIGKVYCFIKNLG